MTGIRRLLRQILPCVFLASALVLPAYAQKQEIVQLQRDLAILQVEFRQLKGQFGERVAVLEELIKQNLEATNKLNQAIAVIERSVSKQDDSVVRPVTSMSSQIDSLARQFGGLRDAVEALNSRVGKLQQQVQDIQTHLTTLPPPSFGEENNGQSTNGMASAETLFNAALSDYHRGNFETAKLQFNDYLKSFGHTLRAPEAQYYLGDIAYQQEDYSTAISNYDQVLERFPEGRMSADALYKKGLSLMKLNKLDEAAAEFRTIVERYPNSNIVPNAKGQIEMIEGGPEQGKPSPIRRSSP